MSIPQDITDPMPWVGYQHGTTNGPQNVPSNLEADYIAAVAYSAFGFISTAPDYIGMGESRGFHPYIHDATQARAGIDMLYAVKSHFDVSNLAGWNNQLFVSGYSQGGHAAMAMLRELEKNHEDVFPVTAATPMSGPYNVSGVMVDLINQEEPYGTAAYIPYVVLGYQEVYGDLYEDINDVFKPDYVDMIIQFYNGDIELSVLNDFLVNTLTINEGASIPKRMFQDEFYNDFLNNPDNILIQRLRENDNHNWVSNTPMEIYYCTLDEQVPFQNALVAEMTMNDLGSASVTAINQGALTHSLCALFALPQSRNFFQSFMISGVQHIDKFDGISIGPNPTNAYINIKSELFIQIDQMTIYDAQGKVIMQEANPNLTDRIIDLSSYSSGIFYIQLLEGNISSVNKIMLLK